MKIISKYKDYYDYLQGVYGIDAKLVYDRTDFYKPYYEKERPHLRKEVFYICGYRVEGLWVEGKILYGYEIPSEYIYSDFYGNDSVLRNPSLDSDKNNEKFDCPVLYECDNPDDLRRNPILSHFEMQKVYSADEIWVMLSEWLGREKVIPNNQTNIEKVESHGFDKKISFRNRK